MVLSSLETKEIPSTKRRSFQRASRRRHHRHMLVTMAAVLSRAAPLSAWISSSKTLRSINIRSVPTLQSQYINVASRRARPRSLCFSLSSDSDQEGPSDPFDGELNDGNQDNDEDTDDDEAFLREQLARIEQLEDMLSEFEDMDFEEDDEGLQETDDLLLEDSDTGGSRTKRLGDNIDDQDLLWDTDSLTELLGTIDDDDEEEVSVKEIRQQTPQSSTRSTTQTKKLSPLDTLEQALSQGVVPVSASVGTDSLPGDFGFDPLDLSTKDYFRQVQQFLLQLVPASEDDEDGLAKDNVDISSSMPRPRALILRDYREAEIRHSRLAMLAAIFWPLQEMLDRLLLRSDQFGPLIYGPVTLPYFPLLMTAIMLLLGYLDIYSQAIKDMDQIGDAYLPGDCFWDPLRILDGSPDVTKRRMQERELFNGRAAMLAVIFFTFEEATSRKPLIEIEGNALLFQPIYQIPFIQQWLDAQFSQTDPEVVFYTPVDTSLLP